MTSRNTMLKRSMSAELASGAQDPSRIEERALLKRCQEGSADAFEILVSRYEKKVYWIAYNLVGHAEDAQDLAQEAFIRVFRSIDRFNLQYNFYTWLYRIVVNLAIDHLRKNRRQVKTSVEDLTEDPAALGTPEKEAVSHEIGDSISRVLAGLPDKYRTVLVLRDVEELDCGEIARIIHCTPATTRWRLHRARELFAEGWARIEQAETTSR
jgi:RNA polymerase sigma-70 factor (ECF subfamily)